MSKKRVGYIATITLSVVAVYFVLNPLLFTEPAAQAQCVDFKLASKIGPGVDCGTDWTKINEIQTGPECGQYGACTMFTAICIGG